MKKITALLFFLSGFSGLLYQILWLRKFSYVLGTTYLAISVVVASFMAGLFLGSWIVGKFVDRLRNKLSWYGRLEILIGLYALVFIGGMNYIDEIFKGWYDFAHGVAIVETSGRALIAMLTMLLPTAAMGATLPLIVQRFTHHESQFRTSVSVFYSVNALGSATGALVCGFYFIERFGVNLSLWIAAILNVMVGLSALLLARKDSETPDLSHKPTAIPQQKNTGRTIEKILFRRKYLYLFTAAVAGFSSLTLEMVWTRGLRILIDNSTYSFTIIVFVFLLGIAIGSRVAALLAKRKINLHFSYGVLQLALGIYATFTIFFLYTVVYTDLFQVRLFQFVYDYSYAWSWAILVYIVLCGLTFLVPAILMGILFPLLNDVYFSEISAESGKTVSAVYAVNTVGSIAGSLGAGFFLLPALGIRETILAVAVITLVVGIIFVMISGEKFLRTTVVAGFVFVLCLNLSTRGEYLSSREELRSDQVIFYREGLMSTVKVFRKGEYLNMSIDGDVVASTSPELLFKEKMIGHLPFFLKPDIREVLAVGLASGISAASMAAHDRVERIDCVELVPAVFEACKFFSRFNQDLPGNAKVRLIENDAYAFLKYNESIYDLISSDGKLGSLNKANTTMLSVDYFSLCKSRLREGGMFIHWIPLITPQRSFEVILRSLKSVFDHVVLFYFYPSDVFMVASDEPIVLDLDQMKGVMADEKVRNEMQDLEVVKASEILFAFMGTYNFMDGDDIIVNTFDQPVLEFWFMKDWKKSGQKHGGYRAENLEFLISNYQDRRTSLIPIVRNPEYSRYVEAFYEPSLRFYNFCLDNFKYGNYRTGREAYLRFKSALPF